MRSASRKSTRLLWVAGFLLILLTSGVANADVTAGVSDAEFNDIAPRCAPDIDRETLRAVIRVESGFHRYAIGLVGGALPRQPATLEEAIDQARSLAAAGRRFSLGIAQVNAVNLPRLRESLSSIFDVCRNLTGAAKILKECYARAVPIYPLEQAALRAALSCYYSGTFDRALTASYVERVVAAVGFAQRAGNGPESANETLRGEPSALADRTRVNSRIALTTCHDHRGPIIVMRCEGPGGGAGGSFCERCLAR